MFLNREKHNSHFFYKYLFSYLLILCVPLFILGLFLYSFFFKILETEITKNNYNIVSTFQSNFDNNLIELNTIANSIYRDPELSTYQISNSVVNSMKGIKQLNSYVSWIPAET